MKKELTGWWLFWLLIVIATIIALSALNYAGIFTKTVVERKVFEQSYQKQAGDQARLSAYRAQLAAINSKLVTQPNNQDLLSQKAMLEIQIQGALK